MVCGLGNILQTFRIWRFGSGYSLSVASGSALIGTLPNRIGGGNSGRGTLTGVFARRMGVYAGIILITVAFLPKAMALIAAIPRPILAAYIVFTLALLFAQGMRMVVQDGMDAKKAVIVGISFWIGISFQNQLIFPDLLTGTLGTLLSNGLTTGSICVMLLIADFVNDRRAANA